MSKVSVAKEKLDYLANCVSAKSGESIPLTIDEMAEAVLGIQEGGIVDNISTLSGGGSFHDISSADTTVLGTKTITENGTYSASSDNLDGYSSVTVNASGGSSDFSTATITISSLASLSCMLSGAFILSSGGMSGTVGAFDVRPDITTTAELILYNNLAGIQVQEAYAKIASASGNANLKDGFCIVTGDCEITIISTNEE